MFDYLRDLFKRRKGKPLPRHMVIPDTQTKLTQATSTQAMGTQATGAWAAMDPDL